MNLNLEQLTQSGPWRGSIEDLTAALRTGDPAQVESYLRTHSSELYRQGIQVQQKGHLWHISTFAPKAPAGQSWSRVQGDEFDFSQPNRLSQALRLADCGLSLVPIQWGGKKPLVRWESYQKQAPTPLELEDWCSKPVNLAIACGRVSGVIVVDTDSEEAEAWAQENLPPTPIKTLTAKGVHRFYRALRFPVGNKARVVTADGQQLELDIRGDGGYVLAPGCLHPDGSTYQAIGNWLPSDFQQLPDYPATLLHSGPAESGAPLQAGNLQSIDSLSDSGEYESLLKRARRYFQSIPPVEKGQRNHQIYSRANKCLDHLPASSVTVQAVYDALLEHNASWSEPLRESEVRQSYQSALRGRQNSFGAKGKEKSQGGGGWGDPGSLAGPRPARAPQRTAKQGAQDEAETRGTRDDAVTVAPERSRIFLELPSGSGPLMAPKGYEVRKDGVYVRGTGQDGEPVWQKRFDPPVLVVGKLKYLASNEHCTLLWWPQGGIRSVESAVLTDHKPLAKALAANGYATTAERCKSLVDFLCKFETENRASLQPKLISNHFGWQKGAEGFLLGDRFIGGSEEVSFVAQEGGSSLQEAIHAKGQLETWLGLIRGMQDHPKALLCLYASFAAPLLQILGAPSFVIDVCGETSRGKTTLLKACASIYGNPDISDGGLIQGWKTTQVAIERRAGILKNLPVFLDDTRSLNALERKTLVGPIVYMLAQGKGKERGSLKGLRDTPSWRTVAVVSGEGRIIQMSTESGKNTRMLTLWGNPFCGDAEVQKQLVDKLNGGVSQCFGLAGEEWIKFLSEHRDEWANWKQEWEAIRSVFEQMAEGDPQKGRLGGYLACIELAGRLAHRAMDFGFEFQPVPDDLVSAVFSELQEADTPTQALQAAYDWACSNTARFYGRHVGLYDAPPPSGWAGKWSPGDSWECLGFFRHTLEEVLTKAGYDPSEMIQRWSDRGWLRRDGKNLAYRWRLGVDVVRLITLERDYLPDSHDEG